MLAAGIVGAESRRIGEKDALAVGEAHFCVAYFFTVRYLNQTMVSYLGHGYWRQ